MDCCCWLELAVSPYGCRGWCSISPCRGIHLRHAGGEPTTMRTRSCATLLAFVLLLLLLFPGCAVPGSPRVGRSGTAPTYTPLPSPSPTPPLPDPVPTNFPVSTLHPQSALTGLAPVIGATPVWMTSGLAGPAIVHLEGPPPYSNTYFAPYRCHDAQFIP